MGVWCLPTANCPQPGEPQKGAVLKACRQKLNLEGIIKEKSLCLEISSVRDEGN